MNTRQIDNLLRRCKLPGYRGVYPSDRVPGNPGIMVVNLDTHDKPGTHWVAIYIKSDRSYGEYFDSFGRAPDSRLFVFMNSNCCQWVHNRIQLQSAASECCGHYTVMYCIYRVRRGSDMDKFVAHFTKDTGFNDLIVRKAVRLICKSVPSKRTDHLSVYRLRQ